MKQETNEKDRAATPQTKGAGERSRELSNEDLERVTGGLRQINRPDDKNK